MLQVKNNKKRKLLYIIAVLLLSVNFLYIMNFFNEYLHYKKETIGKTDLNIVSELLNYNFNDLIALKTHLKSKTKIIFLKSAENKYDMLFFYTMYFLYPVKFYYTNELSFNLENNIKEYNFLFIDKNGGICLYPIVNIENNIKALSPQNNSVVEDSLVFIWNRTVKTGKIWIDVYMPGRDDQRIYSSEMGNFYISDTVWHVNKEVWSNVLPGYRYFWKVLSFDTVSGIFYLSDVLNFRR